MGKILDQINPDYFLYIGTIGLMVVFLFFFIYIYSRLRWILLVFKKNSKNKIKNPGIVKSIKNLVLISIWIAIFGMILFMGLFLRAYSAFTYEAPVAKIITQSMKDGHSTRIKLIYLQSNKRPEQNFIIHGDQWMLEGDILKWDNWINFIGIHSRYRLTRIRGRYNDVSDEIQKTSSIYAIGNEFENSKWKYLYQFGEKIPFVNSVYGNGVFQNNKNDGQYFVYVTDSGFMVKKEM